MCICSKVITHKQHSRNIRQIRHLATSYMYAHKRLNDLKLITFCIRSGHMVDIPSSSVVSSTLSSSSSSADKPSTSMVSSTLSPSGSSADKPSTSGVSSTLYSSSLSAPILSCWPVTASSGSSAINLQQLW